MNRFIKLFEQKNRLMPGVLLSGVVAFLLGGCQLFEAQPIIVTKGSAVLVRFPDYWDGRGPQGEKIIMTLTWYEVRFAPDSTSRELLFAAMSDHGYWGEIYSEQTKEKPNEDWYSLNFYAVTYGEKPIVRPVGKEEWNRATRASGRSEKLFPVTQEDLKLRSFQYQNRSYSKTSDNWGAALLSPNGKWLAVFSYSGRKNRGSFWWGGEPRRGDVFWEVYNTFSGEKVLSWNARSVDNPVMESGGAVWVGEEYIVTPFDLGRQSCVIGVLPQK
jgi:hypothetical protein